MVETRGGALKSAADTTSEASASAPHAEVSSTSIDTASAAPDEGRPKDPSSLVADAAEKASKRGREDVAGAPSRTMTPAEWRAAKKTSSMFGDSSDSEEVAVLRKTSSEYKKTRWECWSGVDRCRL